ncbi:CaiB/BaiF CoA-transferase family protein [Microbacterium sp. AK031]|uniref:CaiB/BaiF CoA transferase family protein n=1 Tax=Microbacterium sp. AK031 TaxID=2723076 RepID=UPI00216A02DF|nr:CaiB/BaiF CoA-transferase family protein [Microbacterium sp. AK031]MCS3843371.1 crotonobetainyl-CoA:carnitine CoA-transferase CaiB-like acyl-CoA transferase [Microbacterium sp. AK031]
MTGPLDGIVVLDFTERVQGPYATQMLGDLGADVIKVERHEALTPDGRSDERYATEGSERPSSLYRATFLANNRNKRSITLDLKSDRGHEVAAALVAKADVVYENFRPGAMARLGLDYDDCVRIKPDVIYLSASGYGDEGPYVTKPGQDVLVQALSGMGVMNESADGRPTPVGMSITDVLGGLNGAAAVLAAIVHRERTGEGQRVSVDLLGSALAAMSEHIVHFANNHPGEPVRGTRMHGHGYIPPPYGFYATSDGHIALSSGRQISEICALIGLPDLTEDTRFDSFEKRNENRAEMESLLEARLSTQTTAHWLAVLEPADIFVARVNSLGEALADPQVVSTQRLQTVDGPDGPLTLVASPLRFSHSVPPPPKAPPEHGGDTAAILAELGLPSDHLTAHSPEGALT